MADQKISALTSATLPLAGTEVLPIVQSSTTKKVATDDLTVKNVRSNATTGILQIAGPGAGTTRTMTTPDANFTAARTDAAQSFTGDQTLSTGNLIQGTAAKGINFTANTPAAGMTSQLLNWYEEGTWTPLISSNGAGTVNFVSTTASGKYTRIGRQVTITCVYTYTSIGSVANDYAWMSGLPFTSSNDSIPSLFSVQIEQSAFDTKNYQGLVLSNSKLIAFRYNNGGGALYAGGTYMVGNSFPGSGTVRLTATYFV